MMHTDVIYNTMLRRILSEGTCRQSRPGVDTFALFGERMVFNISCGKIPLLTTKKMFYRSFIEETLWFISGSTNIAYLKEKNISIWDNWVEPLTAVYDDDGRLVSGDIGKGSYGAMWRRIDDVRLVKPTSVSRYETKGFHVVGEIGDVVVVERRIDQLQNAIDLLKTQPDSRRILVCTFDPRMVDFAQLPPCHSFFQFLSREMSYNERHNLAVNKGVDIEEIPNRALTCILYCRSQDFPVGTPFNIAQYALLTHMVANVVGMEADELVWMGGDVHVYSDQEKLALEQIERVPFNESARVVLPKDVTSIDDYNSVNVDIVGYENFHPAIKYPVAV